jgi:hypothetical protein
MSYLKKLGIQIKDGWVHYKNKHVPFSKIDNNNFYETLLKPLGIRKTRGTDFYDGKRFIKPTILTELSNQIRNYIAVTIKFDWTNIKYDKTHENKMTSFVSKVINDQLLQDKAREAAFEYAKSRLFLTMEKTLRSPIYKFLIRDQSMKLISEICLSLGQHLHILS